MKPVFLILIATLSIGLKASAFDDTFNQAQAAYDSGNYADAALGYETLLSNGVSNVEVHYNLGNAYFKEGKLPKAIWQYRKAWYGAPGDPDIRANLHYALSATGAIEPAPTLVERFFTSISSSGWVWIAVGSYLVLFAMLMLALLWYRARAFMLRLSLLPLAVLLLALGGWLQWRQFRKHPEGVVINSGITALYAPIEGGTAFYKLPMGALVRQRNIDPKGWEEVQYDGKSGWVKTGNILYLSP